MTLCHRMNCSLPGSSVHEILQARILEWVVISSSRESSSPRDRMRVSCIGRWILYHWVTRETLLSSLDLWGSIREEIVFPELKSDWGFSVMTHKTLTHRDSVDSSFPCAEWEAGTKSLSSKPGRPPGFWYPSLTSGYWFIPLAACVPAPSSLVSGLVWVQAALSRLLPDCWVALP